MKSTYGAEIAAAPQASGPDFGERGAELPVEAETPSRSATISVSLVSHTNVGKTTLARTLLRRDIGDVRDRPHVTETSELNVLIDTPQGDALRLWDTPGFGDSARLLKRLRASDNPIGWFLTQVWDRIVDRPFYSSQQAIRNVREESDVVLYLVSAAEDPGSAGYVEAEMQILDWLGKPVLLLLNQTGPPREAAAEAADEAAWRRHLARHPLVRGVIGLDAFARCWVQEDRFLGAIGEALAADRRAAFVRLRDAWRSRNLQVFDASMKVLAEQLASAAADREPVTSAPAREEAGRWLGSLIRGGERGDPAAEAAMHALAKRVDASLRAATDRLIVLHGLSGRAVDEIPARMAGEFNVSRPADIGKTGAIGGLVSGALGGLAADLAAGGVTFGAGALIGAVLGALGAGGAAKAYNLVRGTKGGSVMWSHEFLHQRFRAALLRYLAVAHFGRGRGDWAEAEYPPHWQTLVDEVVAPYRDALDAFWSESSSGVGREALSAQLEQVFRDAARELLLRLYPEASAIFRASGGYLPGGASSEFP